MVFTYKLAQIGRYIFYQIYESFDTEFLANQLDDEVVYEHPRFGEISMGFTYQRFPDISYNRITLGKIVHNDLLLCACNSVNEAELVHSAAKSLFEKFVEKFGQCYGNTDL